MKEPTKPDSKPKLNIQSYEEVKLEEQMEKLTFESLKETYEAKEQEKLNENEEEEESNENETRN